MHLTISTMRIGIFCLFIICWAFGFSQVPTTQDCLGAIPICQEVYMEVKSPVGSGNYSAEVNGSNTCLRDGENNSTWYTFTVSESGLFGFVLAPNKINDDYDWGLYDITSAGCEELFTNPSLLVSCNSAGNAPCHGPTGPNGGSIYNIQGFGCGIFPPTQTAGFTAENALFPVVEGNTYVLIVDNWTGSTSGYTLDFSISEVGIFDLKSPEVASLVFPQFCSSNEITISYSEFVECDQVNASDFELTGPGGPYTIDPFSNECAVGATYSKRFVLRTDPPITESGEYTMRICCVSDVCGNELVPVERTFDVQIYQPLTLNLGAGQELCRGEEVLLDATNEAATYEWQDGSSDPIFSVLGEGTYAVTVTTPCESLSDEVTITYLDAPDFDLGRDTVLCEGETLLLNAAAPQATYLWHDGQAEANYMVEQEGVYRIQTENLCGILEDSISVLFTNRTDLELGEDRYFCEGDILLEAGPEDERYEYTWQNGQPTPTYLIQQGGTYHVQVESACGLLSDTLQIFPCEVCDVYIPNAFSPNFDGINDYLEVYTPCDFLRFEMEVFNRWGGLVYSAKTNSKAIKWDGTAAGKELDTGVYVWQISYELSVNGIIENHALAGTITLLK